MKIIGKHESACFLERKKRGIKANNGQSPSVLIPLTRATQQGIKGEELPFDPWMKSVPEISAGPLMGRVRYQLDYHCLTHQPLIPSIPSSLSPSLYHYTSPPHDICLLFPRTLLQTYTCLFESVRSSVTAAPSFFPKTFPITMKRLISYFDSFFHKFCNAIETDERIFYSNFSRSKGRRKVKDV